MGHIKVRHMCMTSKTYMRLIKWTFSDSLARSLFLPLTRSGSGVLLNLVMADDNV